ncbi:MAG TPA: hypothetical protein VM452_12410 [Caulifigura sp.]|jgi:hypothetical protein|nr:hypothetical protein [Caulifigura sp.]
MTDVLETGIERPASGMVVPGKVVVVGMFAFGLLLTGVLYGYWELHTRPFRSLQEAIAREVPGSSPRVLGGRHKSHLEGSPNTLRMIVRVGYNPLEPANEGKRDDLARRVLMLAKTHHDPAAYEKVELHLEQRIPEKPAVYWSSVRSPGEWDAFVEQAVQPGSLQ